MPGRSLCKSNCAGGAGVVKKMPPSKIAAEFSSRGLRARIDAIELNHVLRSHTAGHGPQLLSRGALAHSVRAVWCDCALRSGRAF